MNDYALVFFSGMIGILIGLGISWAILWLMYR